MRLGFVALVLLNSAVGAQEPAPIQDNSFLIEEAYNQEARVVQHISAFLRFQDGWWYTFTQEWPAGGQQHQLSYTVLLFDGGFGDLALNYRFQLAGPGGRLAVSPRLSAVLPTGSWRRGYGFGATGVQLNLPVSARVARRILTHWNAGATVTPDARNVNGDRATSWALALGASVILEARHDFNVMLEIAWSRIDGVVGPSLTRGFESFVMSPGVRWAHTLANGLQIVPGVAVPLGIGVSKGPPDLFLYLSFEHAF
jgi:hypothetical protein